MRLLSSIRRVRATLRLPRGLRNPRRNRLVARLLGLLTHHNNGVDHGHDDTDVPYRLLPTRDDLRALTRYQERQARRDRLAGYFMG